MRDVSSTQFNQENSDGILLNGLLAELLTILDSFFSPVPQWGGWLGVVGRHEVAGKMYAV